MKMLIKSLFFLICIFVIHSCDTYNASNDPECVDADYSDCETIDPDSADLIISLTMNSANPEVIVTVYKGEIESKEILSKDYVSTEEFLVYAPVNKYYSVTAEYSVDGKRIIAVDGGKLKKIKSTYCDSTCWTITGGEYDVKLKYSEVEK